MFRNCNQYISGLNDDVPSIDDISWLGWDFIATCLILMNGFLDHLPTTCTNSLINEGPIITNGN